MLNWLDINFGEYPFVTSANTFPYSACSLGFSPRKIRDIYGAAKIYDTRVGVDPNFSDDLLDELIELLEKSDSFNYTKILIRNHFERAIQHLSIFPKSNAKLLLENVAEYATTRKL